MIPLVPTLSLAFVSFLASAFVILRIIIPILPPHPLSKRVSPAEFGLPTFRSLSPADRSHLWLASLDLVALAIFVWEAVNQATGGLSGYANAGDPASSVRLWITLTLRQTLLLVVTCITLLHIRLGRPVSFGKKHWILWAPSLVLVVTSTSLSGIISGAGVLSLFYGLVAYSSTFMLLTMIAFGCLIGTLFVIKRNLAAINDEMDPWPPLREAVAKPRPSFATEDIDALREGGSWISSNSSSSSRRNSISAWSFSTHQTATPSIRGHGRPQNNGHHSVPARSSYWFSAASREHIPPVPPLPSPYAQGPPTAVSMADPDPFRKDNPLSHPRERLGSQSSWLTSTDGSRTVISAWSFPTTQYEPSVRSASVRDLDSLATAMSRPVTPALASAQVLGGYGYAPGETEKSSAFLATAPGTTLDVSLCRNIGWFSFILLPYAFSLPYLIIVSHNIPMPLVASILFILSITLSSPILALNVFFKCPFPIPTGLFDVSTQLPVDLREPKESGHPAKWSHQYKRSMTASVTVVEGRRSGDVWLAKGDAVDRKGKIGRAVEVLNPLPKLSVLPPEECSEKPELTPPLPIQDEDLSSPVKIHSTPSTDQSTRLGHGNRESKASSHLSGNDETLTFASRIMIAQRHYSALAQTVIVPSASPEKESGIDGEPASRATGAVVHKTTGHLRSRSITSINEPETPTPAESFRIAPTPPPPFPLPPTPPNVRAARLARLAHKKSFSSGFNVGSIDDMNEIDALTAGVLPLLVPGLRVGGNMKIKEDGWSPDSYGQNKGPKTMKKLNDFGLDFSSPQYASTPARRTRGRKESGHRRNHYSLPSLGLGKDGIHCLAAWTAEMHGAIEKQSYQYSAVPSNVEVGWRNTVFGAESVPNDVPHLQVVTEEEEIPKQTEASLRGSMSTGRPALRLEVPHDSDPCRLSLLGMQPPLSAASSATLFEDITVDFACSPQAESTPHNTMAEKKARRQPPFYLDRQGTKGRSSIVYFKSEDNVSVTPPILEPTTASTISSIAQWSTRAVKPLATKASKLQRKISVVASSATDPKSSSPGAGLRPLSLLQDRNTNTAGAVLKDPRPLILGKKQKARKTGPEFSDENTGPDVSRSSSIKKLRPLKLSRTETSKKRGILRQNEILPEVIIRPPSNT